MKGAPCPRCAAALVVTAQAARCPHCGFAVFKQPTTSIRADSFYPTPAPSGGTVAGAQFYGLPAPDVKAKPDWMASPFRFAALILGLGSATVFFLQAFIVYQIVLGAPIFEEFFKFGLALLLVAPATVRAGSGAAWLGRVALAALLATVLGLCAAGFWGVLGHEWNWLIAVGTAAGGFAVAMLVAATAGLRRPGVVLAWRLVVAWMVGLSFGLLEHWLSYSGEPQGELLLRLLFHAASPGLSMALFHVLEPGANTSLRWMSTSAASVLHYLNNAGALLIAVALSAAGIATVVSATLSGLLVVLAIVLQPIVLTNRQSVRQVLARLGARLLRIGRVGPA